MTTLGLALFAAISAGSGCHPVEGEHITAHDVAAADSRFTALPETVELGYSPAPGVRRLIRASELSRLAGRFGIASDGIADLCFERPLHALDPQEMMTAMLSSLGIPEARIEIAEAMRFLVPSGAIDFPLTGLAAPQVANPDGPVLWRGYILTAGKRRFPIWARIKIAAPLVKFVATADLKAGATLASGEFRKEKSTGFPDARSGTRTPDDITGRKLLRPVRAGAGIPLSALEPESKTAAGDVARGDTVTVDVKEGAAHLTFEARAEAPGRTGQTIAVRNIQSGKNFQAQVTGKGKVSVGEVLKP